MQLQNSRPVQPASTGLIIKVLTILAWLCPVIAGVTLMAAAAAVYQPPVVWPAWTLLAVGIVLTVGGVILVAWGDSTGRMPPAQRRTPPNDHKAT